MARDFYYVQNGNRLGPVSAAELKQLGATGQLQPTDLVWKEGMASWVPASSVKGLFGSPEPSPRPPALSGTLAFEDAPPPLESVPNQSGLFQSAKSKAGKLAAQELEALKQQMLSGKLMDMNPIVVLVLTVCTFGIFGYLYTFLVGREYSELASHRTTDSKGRPLGKARHPSFVLLASYLTCGIYAGYWIYKVMQECSDYSGRRDFNPRTEYSLMFCFPLYALYLTTRRLPEMIRRAQHAAGLGHISNTGEMALSEIGGDASSAMGPCAYFTLPMMMMSLQDALNEIWFGAK